MKIQLATDSIDMMVKVMHYIRDQFSNMVKHYVEVCSFTLIEIYTGGYLDPIIAEACCCR